MMEDQREPIRMVKDNSVAANHTGAWLGAGIVVLMILLGLSVGYIYQQQSNSKQVASQNADMSATISQMQSQIETLTSKVNQPPVVQPAPSAAASQPGTASAASRRRTAAENKRLKEMQAKLDDQQKQLKDTQDAVAQTRSDLASGLDSTRNDLNGSIARTHDELVSLEQRGERNYFEFDLTKAKHFQREGPISVSLRKADPKHKRYDLALVVDDNQLSKKNVNLYEPVWINGSDMQQVQLVVNKVDKDHVHGYVSAPKYAQSAGMTPVSARTTMKSTSDTDSAPATNSAATSSDTSSTTSSETSPTTPEQPQ
jgi:cell division protein FtsB